MTSGAGMTKALKGRAPAAQALTTQVLKQ